MPVHSGASVLRHFEVSSPGSGNLADSSEIWVPGFGVMIQSYDASGF